MKILLTLLLLSFVSAAQAAEQQADSANTCPEVLQVQLNDLYEEPANLCDYAGQVVLVVNTASYCGFTDQYKGLEALYRKYHDRGFTVLGFPSNDFGKQEPGSSKEIAEFCKLTYGVEFPMFEKARIISDEPSAPFPYLIEATGQAPKWNFHKYLISRDGKTIKSFASSTGPDAPNVVAVIETMLAQ